MRCKLRVGFLLALFVVLVACEQNNISIKLPNKQPAALVPEQAKLTFADVKKIFEADCALCHRKGSATGPVFFESVEPTETEVKAKGADMLARLTSDNLQTVMPSRNLSYKNDPASGKKLIEWLKQR